MMLWNVRIIHVVAKLYFYCITDTIVNCHTIMCMAMGTKKLVYKMYYSACTYLT